MCDTRAVSKGCFGVLGWFERLARFRHRALQSDASGRVEWKGCPQIRQTLGLPGLGLVRVSHFSTSPFSLPSGPTSHFSVGARNGADWLLEGRLWRGRYFSRKAN